MAIGRVVALLLLAAVASANVYDLFFPAYIAGCPQGCLDWSVAGGSNQTFQQELDALFIDGKAPANASNFCAMPGASAGAHECDCSDVNETIMDSFAGPWCVCRNPASSKDSDRMMYCTPPTSVPEQINVQLATADTVVVSFVTYEAMPTAAPVAMFGTSPDNMQMVSGVAHDYKPPGREYVLNFVKLSNLSPRQRYFYKVKSGSSACVWSDVYSFRAGYTTGKTVIATYGDMGHSHYNNMANLMADCAAGTIDAIVHMGDHCYDLGMADDRRGDAYMNVFQPVIANCPWFPIIGNHEASDGDHFGRYLNMTWGEAYGTQPGRGRRSAVRTTAHSSLGHLLTKGTFYGMGVHGNPPSNTSRYVSADFGLIHMVGLDLNNLDVGQLAWLDADLKAANDRRDQVPWIMVSSHFPLYHSTVAANANSSAIKYIGDDSEHYATEGHEFFPCDSFDDCKTVGDLQRDFISVLQPLFVKYGVDLYNAGHVHDYESTWPICGNGQACQKNYSKPIGTVHICEGNGGVPGVEGTWKLTPGTDFARMHGTGGAYGRITAFNATHLQYEHVQNNGGVVTDSFVIYQPSHGPFPK